jgi:hypothetical protein
MKTLLFVLLFFPTCDDLLIDDKPVNQVGTYYIDPAGSDSGNGSASNPWKSLYKACNSVSAGVIKVRSGTYTETLQAILATGVSIEGEGNPVIKHRYANTAYFEGAILLEGGNGLQHISGITLDGDNLAGVQGVAVYARSNVSIYNCVIKDFAQWGVKFGGTGSTNNSFHDNTVINCGGQPNHTANLYIGSQTNFLCYNNTITQTARATNLNGNCVSGYEGSYGMKFYNNTITAAPNLPDGIWKFAIEIWLQSGCEMYGNTVRGEIDFGKDVTKGSYPYGLSFHNNIVGWDAVQSVSTNGLQFEQTTQSVNVYNNTFRNLDAAIYFCQYKYSDDFVEDVYIYGNVIYNCGKSVNSSGWGIRFESGSDPDDQAPPTYYDNVNIFNNTIVAYQNYPAARGIELPTHATTTSVMNISVKNNIIIGFSVAGIAGRQQDNDYPAAIDYLTIQNNLLYSNGNNNDPLFVGFTPTHYTITGVLKNNPLFVSPTDFHITSASPAYHSGVYAGTITDRDGVTYSNPPSRGAYEYASTPETGIIKSGTSNVMFNNKIVTQ